MIRSPINKRRVQAALFCLAAAFLPGGAALANAQSITEVLAIPNASGQDVLVDPFSPNALFLAARTAQWDEAILQADLTQAPPVTILRGGQLFGSYVYPRHLRACPPVPGLPGGALIYLANTGTASTTAWQVRWSLDTGASWNALDPSWQLAPGANASATGFATDALGVLYVSGWAFDRAVSPQRLYWIIRRTTDQGAHWTTFRFGKGGNDSGQDMAYLPVPPDHRHQGGVFAVGILNGYWTAMRTRDGGNNWQTVDVFSPRNGSGATAITTDPVGNIYVGGTAGTKTGNQWTLRRSTDGGDTWMDLGTPLPVSTNLGLSALAIGGGGTLWAVGLQGQRWVMQRWNPITGWNPSPYYPFGIPGSQTESAATGASSDPNSGAVYVTGYVRDQTGAPSLRVLELGF